MSLAKSDGTIYNPKNPTKSYSTGREFAKLQVRDWDQLVASEQKSLWYWRFEKTSGSVHARKARFTPSTSEPINALKGSGLDFVASSSSTTAPGAPVNCDISDNGIVFVGRSSSLSAGRFSSSNVFHIACSTFAEQPTPSPRLIETRGFLGKSSLPTFSSDGKALAFLRLKDQRELFGNNCILVVSDLRKTLTAIEREFSRDNANNWSLSPEFLLLGDDAPADRSLYVLATECGRRKLFRLSLDPSASIRTAVPVYNDGPVVNIKQYDSRRLLVTSTSFVNSCHTAIVDPLTGSSSPIPSLSDKSSQYGLSSAQVSDIWYPGAGGYDIHAWVIRPSKFQHSAKYPLALITHGGPQAAWVNAWSIRWNPVLFAEQGYVAILLNITGKFSFQCFYLTY